jgi:hypothetical protein
MNVVKLGILAWLLLFSLACGPTAFFPEQASPSPFTPESVSLTAPAVQRFENDTLAFDYPAGARIFPAQDAAFQPYPFEVKMMGELAAGLALPHWMKNGVLYRGLSGSLSARFRDVR